MSLCINIPQCVEIRPRLSRSHMSLLQVTVKNACDYEVAVHLYVKNSQNQVVHSTSVELRAYEERSIEVVLESQDIASVSGEWSLRGTSLRLPIKEFKNLGANP